jgi:DNA-directed RNA polymerase subunit RPC12/RpoP
MSATDPRGMVYRCPVCGAEITVLARGMDRFCPRCCNRDMVPRQRRVAFYICPICGAEIAVIKGGAGEFGPRCCNQPMELEAA